MDMRSMRLALVGLLSMFACVFALAQVNPTKYTLKPRDIVLVQVYNEAQVNAICPVLPDGRIAAPFVGLVEAAGKTTAEVEAVLTDLYKAKLKILDPKVSVTIQAYRPLRASATGMFFQQGKFEDLQPGDNLLTLVSKAGPNFDRGDLHRATLIRANSRESIPIDLYAMLYKNDLSQNYPLEDGDVINIPEDVLNRINVAGAVAQPGVYPYKEPMYLVDVISAARGPVPTRAKTSEVMIIRKRPGTEDQMIRIKANLVNWRVKGDIAQNVLLMPGDFVYVPETKTPDINQLNAIFNSLFVIDRLLTGGFLGLKLFGG